MKSIFMLAKYILGFICFAIIPIFLFVVLYKKLLRKLIFKEKDALGYTKFFLGSNYEPSEDYTKVSRYILVVITFLFYYAFYSSIVGVLYIQVIEQYLK